MKWNLANLLISVAGAAFNLFLLSQPHGHHLMFAIIAVLLTLRAVVYGDKLRKGSQ